jgi:hypothetical protein
MTRAVNWPTPGSVVSVLTRGSALGVLAQLAVDPLDQQRYAVDDRQGVGHDLPGDRGQLKPGQPAAAGPGQVAAGPIVAEVSHHCDGLQRDAGR